MALPKIYAGRRRRLLIRLVGNGVLQAATAFALASFLHRALVGARGGDVPWPLVAGVAASGLVILVLRTAEAGDAERLGQDYVMRVRLRIFERIARRPFAAGGRARWGVTMTRLISDLNSLRNWVSEGIARAIVATITLAGLLGALAWLRSGATIAAAAMILLTVAATAALTPTLRSYVREARKRRGRLANNLGEKVFAFQTVRHFGSTAKELRRVRSHSRQLRDALVRRMRAARVLRSIPVAIKPMAVALLIAVVATGDHTGAEIAVAILLLGMIASALGDLTRAWDYRLAFEEGRRRIGEVLAGPQLREDPHAIELPGSGGVAVRFERAAVARRLEPVTLVVQPGEAVLVCGDSGCGKTTLLALAARMLDPDEGEVEIDGIPVARLALESLYTSVQLVGPSLPLLRGTVAQNLGYGTEDLDVEWLETVSKACGLLDADALLPEGLETPIAEQGRDLPDGLRARIALARAAARKPRLLLVDDPAFLMDSAAQAALRRILLTFETTALIVGSEANPPCWVDRIWQLGEPPDPIARAARTAARAGID